MNSLRASGVRIERCPGLPLTIGIAMCVALAGLAGPACSTNPSEDPGMDEVTQAGVVTPDWIHPACDISALAPPANDPNQCNGPWTYSYQEQWTDRAACGDPPVCQEYKSCPSWDKNIVGDGLGYDVHSSFESGPTLIWVSVPGGFGPPEVECPIEAAARRAALIAASPGMSQPAQNGFTVTWTSENEVAWQDGCGPYDQYCQSNLMYNCGLHINNFPTIATAEHPWCGCATYVPPVECPRGDATNTFTSSDVPKPLATVNETGADPGLPRIA